MQLTADSSQWSRLGNQNDILRGNAGDDVLVGGTGNGVRAELSGRNILNGGGGANLVRGVGYGRPAAVGQSPVGPDAAILRSLLTEWASADIYQVRVDLLLGTNGAGLNAGFCLNATSKTDDGDADDQKGRA